MTSHPSEVPLPNFSHDFTGRTVVVTGAARGIGQAVGAYFRAAGATVYLADRDEQDLKHAATEIGATGIPTDVTDTAEVEWLVGRVISDTGRLDVLVNNAGILRDAMLWNLTDADWDAVLAVHLGGTFRCTRAAVRHFREQQYGRVINMTSYTGLRGNPGQANYAAAKAGIIGFTKTAAKELARFGTTVNAVSPNAETRMISSIPPERREAIAATIPLGRFGTPGEMAAAVAFLASEEAGYITGTVLPVDGGVAI
ncbi:3-oxoacyl-ACP reductase FabG [Kribbella sp. NBC_00709]|uniref:3-oxoacyl-ACP reductase FabG n=1 Tax=Kribbella sp. NBC_00709 TaxID=2975972 RepID=UPI002E2AD8EF|nr:3-oxoacyl-ACP reductase FabG [Kribbella sp. NBC_00709]